MNSASSILPHRGRWQPAGLTERAPHGAALVFCHTPSTTGFAGGPLPPEGEGL
jgi:hypothetical protein